MEHEGCSFRFHRHCIDYYWGNLEHWRMLTFAKNEALDVITPDLKSLSGMCDSKKVKIALYKSKIIVQTPRS